MERRGRLQRWALPALLGLTALALLAMVVLVWNTVDAEREQRTQVMDTSRVLGEIQSLRRALVESESGQRGYLLSLDSDYIDSYREGRDDIFPAIERLEEALGADMSPRQGVLLRETRDGARTVLTEMDRQLDQVARGGIDVSRTLIFGDGEEALMSNLRSKLDELQASEEDLLITASQRTEAVEARVFPLLALFAFLVLASVYFTFKLVRRTAQAEAEASHAAELEVARDRADLLAKELNHRVKNLFAVVLAIVQMTGRDKPEAKPVVTAIADRIRALLTAHEVTQGALDKPVASIRALVETTLAPYLSENRTAKVGGPEVMLPARQVTPLGLVLHELVTNAVKYGCWQDGGLLEVRWSEQGGNVQLDWQEHCPGEAVEPERRGFGSLLMEGSAKQLGGSIARNFTADGVRVAIIVPLIVD